MQPYAPLGTMYAAACARAKGYEVAIHDVMFMETPESIGVAIETFKPEVVVIYDDGFNYLTKMCLTNMREAAFRMIQIAKDSCCKVCISSSDSTDHFDIYLEQGADYVILGEGEQTLLDLLNGIQCAETTFNSIPGIAFQDGSKAVVKTLSRPVLTDLDSLPLPGWDLIDMESYRSAWMQSSGYFSINMNTTRGCPFKCNW